MDTLLLEAETPKLLLSLASNGVSWIVKCGRVDKALYGQLIYNVELPVCCLSMLQYSEHVAISLDIIK